MAAGSGTRFGAPKQFEALAGRRVVDWSVDVARRACDGVVVVLPPGVHALDVMDTRVMGDADRPVAVVAGGATRSASVRAGLDAVPAEASIVVVHDGARPLASDALFARVVAAVEAGADGVIPVVDVTDTIKRVRTGRVVETLDRAELAAVQTPQGFVTARLRAVHHEGAEATDDAALVEAAGGQVVVVEGETTNIKITEPHDLLVAEALLTARL